VKLIWDAIPDRAYRVQYKANLSATNWTDLPGDVTGSPVGIASKTDTSPGAASQRFYRVVLLP
jgi:hypothetical protein